MLYPYSQVNKHPPDNLLLSSRLSIIETRFTGYASLAEGQTGTCRAGYTFSGDNSQEVVFQKNLAAPYEDNYNMLAGVGVTSWSPCGKKTAVLNVNSEIRIAPLTSPKKGIMTVRAPWNIKVKWQRCSSSSSVSRRSTTASSSSSNTKLLH